MPQYAAKTEFQWNGDLQLSAGKRVVCHDRKSQDFAAAHAEALLQKGSVSVGSLQEEPFSSLSNSLLNALRDEQFRRGCYTNLDNLITNAVRTSCLQRLNQNTGDRALLPEERGKGLARHAVLLSLISPHCVVSSLCDWVERQTLPEKRDIFCFVLVALENVIAYRASPNEPGILLSWFRDALVESCSSKNTGRVSRLCTNISQLLISFNKNLCSPPSIESYLQFLVKPLLKLGFHSEANEVIQAVIIETNKIGTLHIPENDFIMTILDDLCATASVENRRNGKMDTVEHAFLSISAILSNVSKTFVEKFAARLSPSMTLPVLCRVKSFCFNEELQKTYMDQLSTSIEYAFDPKEFCLKSCEFVIVLSVSLIALELNMSAYEGSVLSPAEKKVGHASLKPTPCSQVVWVLALARQLPMLTLNELSIFLADMHPKILTRAFSNMQSIVLERETHACTEYGEKLMASNLGFRAISLLLKDSNLQTSITKDDFAILRVTRVLCSFVSTSVKGKSGEIVPRVVFLSVLSDIFTMVETACDDEHNYHRSHIGFIDVLLVTVLEVCREMSRVALLVRDYNALEKVSKLMERNMQGNSTARHLAGSAASIFKQVDESPYNMDV